MSKKPKRILSNLTLIQQSTKVLAKHPRLLIFPFLATVIISIMYALAATPLILFLENHTHLILHASAKQYVIFFVGFLVFFFIYNLILTFFYCCVSFKIYSIFHKTPVTLWQAFKHGSARIIPLFLWTLINTTLGIFTRIIESWTDDWEKYGVVQRYLAGLYWAIASLFVMPILMLEDLYPISALKRSSHLIQQRWGGNLRSNVRLGSWTAWLHLLALIPLIIGIHFGGAHNIIVGSTITVAISLIISTFHASIFITLVTALYMYAIDEKFEVQLSEQSLANAFVSKPED